MTSDRHKIFQKNGRWYWTSDDWNGDWGPYDSYDEALASYEKRKPQEPSPRNAPF